MQWLFYASACVTIANIPPAKAGHVAKDKFKSYSLPLGKSHTQRGMQIGVGGIWDYFCILMVSFNEEKFLISM